jgi:hypothetical protein
MDEVDYNKILEELIESRKNRKSLVTSVAPQGYAGSLVSGGSQGIEPINLDFASLYPRTMSMTFPGPKNLKRKRKIRNMFPDIE